MSERVAIIGSRDYPRLRDVYEYVRLLPADTVVVSGGARGVDRTAADAARHRGLEVVEHLPDWKRDGKGAGFIRNAKIVADADRVVAFHNGVSRGTSHSIETAIRTGKPVDVRTPETP